MVKSSRDPMRTLIIWGDHYLCAASTWPGAQRGGTSHWPKIKFFLLWSWGIPGNVGMRWQKLWPPPKVRSALPAILRLLSCHLVGYLCTSQTPREAGSLASGGQTQTPSGDRLVEVLPTGLANQGHNSA